MEVEVEAAIKREDSKSIAERCGHWPPAIMFGRSRLRGEVRPRRRVAVHSALPQGRWKVVGRNGRGLGGKAFNVP
jgi:hypothetical protein